MSGCLPLMIVRPLLQSELDPLGNSQRYPASFLEPVAKFREYLSWKVSWARLPRRKPEILSSKLDSLRRRTAQRWQAVQRNLMNAGRRRFSEFPERYIFARRFGGPNRAERLQRFLKIFECYLNELLSRSD
jgi:hypothetical protein